MSASLLPFILISVNPFAKRKSEQNRLILLDDILLFLMWLQLIATPLFHYATCYVIMIARCTMSMLNLFIIVLVRLNWSFPFFMSVPMYSTSWLMLMINICNGSLHSPDTAALKTALYSVVYVFRKPTFRYLLFMRLFWICSSEATHFFNANLAWCCDNCHYLVRSLRCDQ